MMRRIIYILFIGLFSNAYGQELNFGVTAGFNAYQKMEWDRAIFYPDNSYHVYIEEFEGDGLVNKNSAFDGVNFGLITSLKYKRFSFNMEPQFYYQKTYLEFQKPFYLERVIGKRAFRMPMYFTARLFKKAKSPFLLLGVNIVKENNWDFQDPGFEFYFSDDDGSDTQFLTGDGHFEGMLYDNSMYVNYMIGFGKLGDKWDSSIRLQRELGITRHNIEASIWKIEVAFNIHLISTKDFTKKHFLYAE